MCSRCTRFVSDCDNDVVLLRVTQLGHDPGIACHTGRTRVSSSGSKVACGKASTVLKDRIHLQMTSSSNDTSRAGRGDRRPRGADPDKSYVARLFRKAPTRS